MFWDAVLGGLEVLTHWEAWAAILLYGFILIVPMIAVGWAAERDMRAGCVGMILLPAFQVFAAVVVTWSLLPIILGIGDDAAWGFPWQFAAHAPWSMIKIVLFLVFLAVLSGIVPVLGRVTTFTNLVVGGFAIAIATRLLLQGVPELASIEVDFMPGFGTVLGFVLFGGVAALLASFAVAMIVSIRGRDRSSREGAAPDPIVMAAFGFMGLLPALMYGSWLGLQITARM